MSVAVASFTADGRRGRFQARGGRVQAQGWPIRFKPGAADAYPSQGGRFPWGDRATGTRPKVGPGSNGAMDREGDGADRLQSGDQARRRAPKTSRNARRDTGPTAAGKEKTDNGDQEDGGSRHELRRAVDALDLGSDTMLGIINLYYLGGQMPQYIVQVQVQICRKTPNI
jgi:hypothetical protein